ncbi:hypothetical protein CPAR01_10404, partial [Colletotrichum paranaense]
ALPDCFVAYCVGIYLLSTTVGSVILTSENLRVGAAIGNGLPGHTQWVGQPAPKVLISEHLFVQFSLEDCQTPCPPLIHQASATSQWIAFCEEAYSSRQAAPSRMSCLAGPGSQRPASSAVTVGHRYPSCETHCGLYTDQAGTRGFVRNQGSFVAHKRLEIVVMGRD